MKLFGKELEPGCWRILLRRNTLSEDAIDVDLDYEVRDCGRSESVKEKREFLEKIQKSKEIEGWEVPKKVEERNPIIIIIIITR